MDVERSFSPQVPGRIPQLEAAISLATSCLCFHDIRLRSSQDLSEICQFTLYHDFRRALLRSSQKRAR